jgi:hypothetical protein
LNIDPVPPQCREKEVEQSSGTIDRTPYVDSQIDVATSDLGWLDEATQNKLGRGQSGICDPQQTGHIINEQGMAHPNRDVLYRYSKSLRGADEAIRAIFSDIVVIDDAGKAHQVPIFIGPPEKAVAYILQENTRKDNSTVVDRLRLPMMAIHSAGYQLNHSREIYSRAVDYLRDFRGKPTFTSSEKYDRDTVYGVTRGIPVDVSHSIYVWTKYREDMNQIFEQIVQKFNPIAYIRVKGIDWEIPVKLDSIANNEESDPGDKSDRVIKYQFGITTETFIAQPIVRKKAVLKTRVEVVNAIEDEDITQVLNRLEDAVKEFEG